MTLDCLVALYRPDGGDLQREAETLLDACGASFCRQVISTGDACVGVGTLAHPTGSTRDPGCFVLGNDLVARVGDGLSLDNYFSGSLPPLGVVGDDARELQGSRRFSVAYWNEAAGEMLCARDPLGMEPLFYALLSKGGLAVATRATALIELGDVSRDPDVESYAESVLLLPQRPGATMFRAVRRLPRATMLRFNVRGHLLEKYWQVRGGSTICPDVSQGESIRRHFVSAVDRCLVGVHLPAVAISGGVDSTATLAAVSSLCGGNVLGVSAVFPGDAGASEDRYRDAALRHISHRKFCCVEPHLGSSLAQVMVLADYPSWIPFSSIMTECAMAARREGAHVVLTGEFGDFVAGDVKHPAQWLVRQGRYLEALNFCRVNASRSRGIVRLLKQTLLMKSPMVAQWAVCRGGQLRTRQAILGAISHRVCREYNLSERLMNQAVSLARSSPSFFDAAESFFDHVAVRAMGSAWLAERAAGIRIEQPFGDPTLVRYSARMGLEERLSGGMTRAAFRASMPDWIPETIRQRRSKASLIGPHGRYWREVLANAGHDDQLEPLGDVLGFSRRSVSQLRLGERLEGRKFEFEMFVCAEFLRMYHSRAASNFR